MNSDFVGRPEPCVISRVDLDKFPVPYGKVLCSCGGLIRVRTNGAVTKHDRWADQMTNLGTCPMSGVKAKAGTRL